MNSYMLLGSVGEIERLDSSIKFQNDMMFDGHPAFLVLLHIVIISRSSGFLLLVSIV